ncbi:MBL fold metallo-hydrolase [Altererythrobacter sp. KTW20L]|uniref:alkyl/aryl-sulfatase n=1 Tax=Altererythrobacter sp. KTW20L TaxID=2942210 RepID=UPI0020BEA894|nr:alkyl sulfatase dimerization domain-containing protein [Altererythrobacter sp. KTW20L]MCL6250049.1 MBL fold metallo-hydrolase [Altererythrobacter sp. KTW20L]
MAMRSRIFELAAGFALVTCPSGAAIAQDDATPSTRAALAQAQAGFDWSDERDFIAALRGRIAVFPDAEIRAADGRTVWRFADEEALRASPVPPTVHPLLWRQQQLNAISGLFEVGEGVYQVRGFDLANMTIIEGERGVIVVDPLTTVEVARAALEFYFTHRPRRPVTAVIYTHSHLDHFGGVRGVITPEQVAAGEVAVIAPANFLVEAISENLTAGNAMLRRTIYYSGLMLAPGPFGSVGAGLGPGVSNGTQSFIAPTEEVGGPIANRTIDGVEFVFLAANGTEAPSEFVFYLPQQRILNVAEVAVHTMHNVLTPRGAKARDAALWWHTIDAMIANFGDRTDVLIGQHHWPSWGNRDALDHLVSQRELYKAVHDRSLHLANQGVTIDEIGDAMERPAGLAGTFSVQDHYGTFGSAGQATYQYYLGWYNGNPAHLDPLPSADSAARTIAYMGGADAVLARAREDFGAGEYRWVAEVLDKLVFADPANAAARELQAQTLTQLGYQQSSATWRNVYLTAARELRGGVVPIPPGARSADYLASMTAPMLLDYSGIALSPERARDVDIAIALHFTDLDERYAVTVARGLLQYARMESPDRGPALALALDRATFDALITRRTDLGDVLAEARAAVSGDPAEAARFFTLFEQFTPDFEIVAP